MKSLRPIAALSLLGLALGACASDDAVKLADQPGFPAGYSDGCATAAEQEKSFSTKRVRDDYQFDNDRAYRAGWRQGYLQCGGRETSRNDGGRILGQENEY